MLIKILIIQVSAQASITVSVFERGCGHAPYIDNLVIRSTRFGLSSLFSRPVEVACTHKQVKPDINSEGHREGELSQCFSQHVRPTDPW